MNVYMALMSGDRPSRPFSGLLVQRGLTDDVWQLMNECWKENPSERPSVLDVSKALEGIVLPEN